jgi:hypothetical protein
MKNIIYAFETVASLSAAFFFWGCIILASIKRDSWIKFLGGFALSVAVLFSVKSI